VGSTWKTHLIAIGNSRGVRIPKMWLDQLRLGPRIEMTRQHGQVVIRSAKPPRAGWDEQFRTMSECGDDRLLDKQLPTQWDKDEWEW